jgi:NAD+ kinase
MSRIGFLINPIAGMGGRVGLKGTDGVADEALRRGAKPTANARAVDTLRELKHLIDGLPSPPAVEWLTASGNMGHDALRTAGFTAIEIVHSAPIAPSASDTRNVVERFIAANADLVLFSLCRDRRNDARARYPGRGEDVFRRLRHHAGTDRPDSDALSHQRHWLGTR